MTLSTPLYQSLVPVDSAKQSDWCFESRPNFEFTRRLHSTPVAPIEFFLLSRHYPIAFERSDDTLNPIAVLGIRQKHNLFLTKGGSWQADTYIPALIRAYPFSMTSDSSTEDPKLLVDEDCADINQSKLGEPLFNDLEQFNPFLLDIFQFLESFQEHLAFTRVFSETLLSLNILEPLPTQFTMPSGEPGSINGYWSIDRNALNNLPKETLGDLALSGILEPIYLHLNSLNNLNSLINKTRSSRRQ